METTAYGVADFVLVPEEEEVRGLKIQLGVATVYETILPAVVVGPAEGPKDTIFYLNVSSDKKLMRAAAESLAERILAEADVTAVVTPQSHKSIPCMAEAVRIAKKKSGRDIEFIVLLGGKDESSTDDGAECHKVFYKPITTPEGKWASITSEDIYHLLAKAPSANQVMVIDDVFSRGGTLRGVFELLNGVYQMGDSHEFISAVVAIEQPIQALDPAGVPSFLHAAIIIPEIPGQE